MRRTPRIRLRGRALLNRARPSRARVPRRRKSKALRLNKSTRVSEPLQIEVQLASADSSTGHFSLQEPKLSDVPIQEAALAALVPPLHGSALTRSVRNLLCYNFYKNSAAPKRDATQRAQGVSYHYVIDE